MAIIPLHCPHCHLRKVIEAMGGELDIIARFPDGEVKVNNFSELGDFQVEEREI